MRDARLHNGAILSHALGFLVKRFRMIALGISPPAYQCAKGAIFGSENTKYSRISAKSCYLKNSAIHSGDLVLGIFTINF